MLKRTLVAAAVLALVVSMSPLSAFAKDDMKKDASMKTADTKMMKAEKTGDMQEPVANTIAVCGCGKVFMADEHTQYIEYDGHKYACCSEKCHAMAAAHPETAAKMAQENTMKVMEEVKAEQAKMSDKSK